MLNPFLCPTIIFLHHSFDAPLPSQKSWQFHQLTWVNATLNQNIFFNNFTCYLKKSNNGCFLGNSKFILASALQLLLIVFTCLKACDVPLSRTVVWCHLHRISPHQAKETPHLSRRLGHVSDITRFDSSPTNPIFDYIIYTALKYLKLFGVAER